jgi:hypothetical protein
MRVAKARAGMAASMFQVSRMLRGSAWEKQMVMFRSLWMKAVSVSMTVEREGGYQPWWRAVDALPPHTPPSVVPPCIFA